MLRESQHNSGLNKKEVYFFFDHLGISSLGLVVGLQGLRNPGAYCFISLPSLGQAGSPTCAHSEQSEGQKVKRGMIPRIHQICSHPPEQNLVMVIPICKEG